MLRLRRRPLWSSDKVETRACWSTLGEALVLKADGVSTLVSAELLRLPVAHAEAEQVGDETKCDCCGASGDWVEWLVRRIFHARKMADGLLGCGCDDDMVGVDGCCNGSLLLPVDEAASSEL